jgi:hypothetical protein
LCRWSGLRRRSWSLLLLLLTRRHNGSRTLTDCRTIRAGQSRLPYNCFFFVLRNLSLSQERNLFALNAKLVLGQINGSLVSFQHIEAKQKIDRFALHNGKTAWQEQVAYFDLSRVNTANDVGRADTAGYTSEASINESHDSTCLGTLRRHDSSLSTGIHKRLNWVAIDFNVNI